MITLAPFDWWLWDSDYQLAYYYATGAALVPQNGPFNKADDADNGTAHAHTMLHHAQRALYLPMPWKGGQSQVGFYVVMGQSPFREDIAKSAGCALADVELAMFSGLIAESDVATVDTTSYALSQIQDLLSSSVAAMKDAAAGNAQGAVAAFVNVTERQISSALQSSAKKDQEYYKVEVQSRTWSKRISSPAKWDATMAALRQAQDNHTSFGDVLAAHGAPYQAGLHYQNEQAALDCVTSEDFQAFARDQGRDPAEMAAELLDRAGAARATPKRIARVIRFPFLATAAGRKKKKEVVALVGVPAALYIVPRFISYVPRIVRAVAKFF